MTREQEAITYFESQKKRLEDFRKIYPSPDTVGYQATTKEISFYNMAISALKGFEGMTHRDVLKALFPIDENKGARLTKVYIDHEPIESFALTTTQKWLDSPYKGVSE